MVWNKTGNLQGPPGAGSGGGLSIRPAQTAAFTFALADANSYTPCAAPLTAGVAATLPPNSSVAFPVGTTVGVYQQNSNRCLILGSGGMVVLGSYYAQTTNAGDLIVATKVGTDTWLIVPSLSMATVNGVSFGPSTEVDPTRGRAVYSGQVGGTLTLPLLSGNLFYTPPAGLTANITSIVLSGAFPPATYQSQTISMRFLQPATGGPYTVAFPSSFKFVAGSDTAIQSAANAYTLLVATTFDQGTRWECVMRACGV